MNFFRKKIKSFKKDKSKKKEYILKVEEKFDAAHRLSNYKGKCSRLHGHTYRIVLVIASKKLNSWGAVVDFGDLTEILKENVSKKYDHKTILNLTDKENQVIGRVLDSDWVVWMSSNPTAENMARGIFKNIRPIIKKTFDNIKLKSVTVFETDTNSATYLEE